MKTKRVEYNRKGKCTDCKGGVPSPMWWRCERCAHQRLRRMMSPIPIEENLNLKPRRFRMGDRVLVVPIGSPDSSGSPGTVIRCPKDETYAVKLDSGGRVYPRLQQLRECHERPEGSAADATSNADPGGAGLGDDRTGRGDEGAMPGVRAGDGEPGAAPSPDEVPAGVPAAG